MCYHAVVGADALGYRFVFSYQDLEHFRVSVALLKGLEDVGYLVGGRQYHADRGAALNGVAHFFQHGRGFPYIYERGVESIALSLGEISGSVRTINTATENLQRAALAIA